MARSKPKGELTVPSELLEGFSTAPQIFLWDVGVSHIRFPPGAFSLPKRTSPEMNFMNFLTTKETATLVRRPESTLRRWRSAGKGPPCYKLEGQWAYVEGEVIEWVRANRITFSVRDEHFEREAARVSL
jgi:hypothetical protein